MINIYYIQNALAFVFPREKKHAKQYAVELLTIHIATQYGFMSFMLSSISKIKLHTEVYIFT